MSEAMRWVWRGLYATYCLPFAYLLIIPWWALFVAHRQPETTCWLVEGSQSGTFLTVIEGAFVLGLFFGTPALLVAIAALLIWHRDNSLRWKIPAIIAPWLLVLVISTASSSLYNDRYFEIYRSYQGHCSQDVSE
jgi:Sec-independent protein secretion pathway component TatC